MESRDTFYSTQNDTLDEARELLQEPSRNTKRKILISLNMILALVFTAHVALQLATAGHLPDPSRDNVLMPTIILMNLASAAYNLRNVLRQHDGEPRLNAFTQWATVLILQAVCLSIVHSNPNTATSLLSDQTLSIITIFLTGVILNRRVALAWFFITLVSLFLALKNRGFGFEYVLMTQSELAALKAQAPAESMARLQTAVAEKIVPLPVLLFTVVSMFFSIIAMLATYFEAGLIGQVLGAIPAAIDKIQIAAKQKQKLEQENMRMGLELDVAQRIQAMILPRNEELSKCQGLEVVAKMQPATEVGGDLYDVLPQPDGSTFFAIGDVTDHGLASGVVMLMSQTAIRTCLEDVKLDLVQSLAHVNSVLYKDVQTRMNDGRNLTLSLLHHKDGLVRLAGQHESVIVLRKDKEEAEEIETGDLGCCVGMLDDITPLLNETTFDIKDGDLMLLYTDGATEAENTAHEQFGTERIKKSLSNSRHLPTQEIIDRLFADIIAWIGDAPIYDDITLVLVRKET